jgi:hypothetical protein
MPTAGSATGITPCGDPADAMRSGGLEERGELAERDGGEQEQEQRVVVAQRHGEPLVGG